MSEQATRFARAAEQAGTRVHWLAGWDQVAALALELAGGGRVAVAPSLAAQQPGLVAALGDRALVADRAAPAAVADAAAGLSGGVRLVAETGSVLVSEHDLADRAVSMLTVRLVLAARAADVVASLDDVADWLAGHSAGAGYAALVTGPSKTADIERSLTSGVQGPAEVHVALLGADAGSAGP